MDMERLRILATKTMTSFDAGQYFHLGKGAHLMQLILSHSPHDYSRVRSQQQHRVDVRTARVFADFQPNTLAEPLFILHTSTAITTRCRDPAELCLTARRLSPA
ncbi:hypothetical protein ABVK25_002359 [Lepraria finkii]|uniref:Uncharacterized protein n=1 Tax=Lepraria finkii TaxID=1340010 RepID=A0ABR4BJY8_9LECA